MLTSSQKIHAIEERLHKALFHSIKRTDTLDPQNLYREAKRLIEESGEILPTLIKEQIIGNLIDKITGLGPIEGLMRDPDVTEIMVNGKNDIFI